MPCGIEGRLPGCRSESRTVPFVSVTGVRIKIRTYAGGRRALWEYGVTCRLD
jgi:hypothetical protein